MGFQPWPQRLPTKKVSKIMCPQTEITNHPLQRQTIMNKTAGKKAVEQYLETSDFADLDT